MGTILVCEEIASSILHSWGVNVRFLFYINMLLFYGKGIYLGPGHIHIWDPTAAEK